MYKINDKQERIFEIFDDIIEKDIDLHDYISKNNSLRTRIGRNFKNDLGNTAVNEALRMYGFTGFNESTKPSRLDLYRCFDCNEVTYEIKFDEDFVNHISTIHNTSPNEVKSLAKTEWLDEIRLEMLSKFVANNDEDFLANPYTYKENSRIRGYFRCIFGDINTFREAFGINKMLNPNRTMQGHYYYIEAGKRFEEIIKRCFDANQTEVYKQVSIGNCRPDFVLGDSWMDAKLSKSTTFYGSKTIEKYTKHTDALTIIYAIEDVRDESIPLLPQGVDLIHVLDYFSDLPQGLQDEIKVFISEVRLMKRGGFEKVTSVRN